MKDIKVLESGTAVIVVINDDSYLKLDTGGDVQWFKADMVNDSWVYVDDIEWPSYYTCVQCNLTQSEAESCTLCDSLLVKDSK